MVVVAGNINKLFSCLSSIFRVRRSNFFWGYVLMMGADSVREDKLTSEIPACDILMNFSKQERQVLSSFGTFLLLQQGDVISTHVKETGSCDEE